MVGLPLGGSQELLGRYNFSFEEKWYIENLEGIGIQLVLIFYRKIWN